MEINVKWSESGKTFSVSLAGNKGDFLSIKGCRIVQGNDGDFVGWPATKMDDGKWYRYAWASEDFSAAVLKKAKESSPGRQEARKKVNDDFDDQIPF